MTICYLSVVVEYEWMHMRTGGIVRIRWGTAYGSSESRMILRFRDEAS